MAIDAYVLNLEQAFDPGRLASYYPDDGDKLTMVTNYFWNVALCKEMYLSLGTVEVVMRNAIHDTLTKHFKTPSWYDVAGVLLDREHDAIARAKRDIANAGKEVIPGRVVASVTFGFWTSLLGGLYGESPNGTPLWTPNDAELIRVAFPYLVADHQNRGFVHRRFNAIRVLRNRVGHHEPIFKGVRLQSGKVISLRQMHGDTLETIGWVNPAVRDSIAAIDRFPDALTRGHPVIAREIKTFLGIP